MNQPQPGPLRRLDVAAGEILLWTLSAAAHGPREHTLQALLTEEEAARAQRFHFTKDRLALVVGRGVLRTLLGSYLAVAPRDVPLVTNRFGKPELATGEVHFNVSHSGDVVLIAFCRDSAVGVDVEHRRPLRDLEQLAAQFFSLREQRELEGLSPDEKSAAFFACWTRKEAYIKARGQGLSLPLSEFDVPTHPDAASDWQPVKTRTDSQWFVRSLSAPSGYAGAVCASQATFVVRELEFSGDGELA